MGIDRYTPPIVAHCENIVRFQFHFDSRGVACHGFVHRVVEYLGRQMVECALVRPADIHAGAAANCFEAFQNLDILCGVAFGALGRRVEKVG
jgi:hypothetical protein